MITGVFFGMIIAQSIAYLWFQSKGGVVAHREYMVAHAMFMVGQLAQVGDSVRNGAWASCSIAVFYFLITATGIVQRYRILRSEIVR